jgi:hypothetical protein
LVTNLKFCVCKSTGFTNSKTSLDEVSSYSIQTGPRAKYCAVEIRMEVFPNTYRVSKPGPFRVDHIANVIEFLSWVVYVDILSRSCKIISAILNPPKPAKFVNLCFRASDMQYGYSS